MDRREFLEFGSMLGITIVAPGAMLASPLSGALAADGLSLLASCPAQCTQDIARILNGNGLIDFDLADVRYVLADATHVAYCSGYGAGEFRAQHALRQALQSAPLSYQGSVKLLVTVTANQRNLELQEIRNVQADIDAHMGGDAHVLLGTIDDERMLHDEMSISVLVAYSQIT